MISLKQAEKLIQLAIEQALSIGKVIAVVDSHGELINFVKMDGVSPHAALLAQNKAYTSARDRQKTSSLASWAQSTTKDLGYWTDSRFTGIAGGVPITLNSEVVGAIGIIGLAENEDEAIAEQALKALN